MSEKNIQYKTIKLCTLFTNILKRCGINKNSKNVYTEKTKPYKIGKNDKIFSEGKIQKGPSKGSIEHLIEDLIETHTVDICINVITESELGFAIPYEYDKHFDYNTMCQELEACKENCCRHRRNSKNCTICPINWIIKSLCFIEDNFEKLYLASGKCKTTNLDTETKCNIDTLYSAIQKLEENEYISINDLQNFCKLIENSQLVDYYNGNKAIYDDKQLLSKDYNLGYVKWYVAHLFRWPPFRATICEVDEGTIYKLLQDAYIILMACYESLYDTIEKKKLQDLLCRVQSERIVSYISLAKLSPFLFYGLDTPKRIILETMQLIDDKELNTDELKIELYNFYYKLMGRNLLLDANAQLIYESICTSLKNNLFNDYLVNKFTLYQYMNMNGYLENNLENKDFSELNSRFIIDIKNSYIINNLFPDKFDLDKRKNGTTLNFCTPDQWYRIYGDMFILRCFLLFYKLF